MHNHLRHPQKVLRHNTYTCVPNQFGKQQFTVCLVIPPEPSSSTSLITHNTIVHYYSNLICFAFKDVLTLKLKSLRLGETQQQFARENTWKLLRNVNIYPVKAKRCCSCPKKIVCSPAKKAKKMRKRMRKIGKKNAWYNLIITR